MMRLDHFLFKNHYTQSRNRAKELIKSGLVLVDNEICIKPSMMVADPDIKIVAQNSYVSRAGEKLKSFLDGKDIEINEKICLDVGSSTGGFVQVLLEFGASRVDGVDVGLNQLHPMLRSDLRVKSFEKCDIRDFKSSCKYDIVTCDVSFVGVEHILRDLDRLAKSDIILLFKPQYEVGRDIKRDKKGVVKSKEAIILAQQRFESFITKLGWMLKTKEISKLKGKEGNEEIFYHFRKI